MIKRNISIDFNRKNGKIKPINCLNNGPRFGFDLEIDMTERYRELSPAFVRLSAIEAPNPSCRYLDIHCIFPDMSLDERFFESYDFAPTDRLLASVKDAGAEIFLRLGESPEPYPLKKHTRPPTNYEKYARICEKIIAHYNKGWAHGFKYNIKYVELSACADTFDGFAGSAEEYYRLYSVVANHLKTVFPKLKVGGYTMGGFFALNHYNGSVEEKGYIDHLDNFLSYISKGQGRAPLDFLSWKCYAEFPEEIFLHANYARSYLNQAGFKKTESIITEFNLRDAEATFKDRAFPSRLAASVISAQKSNVDMMFYSDAHPLSPRNSLYTLHDRTRAHLYAPYHVMSAIGVISKLGYIAESTEDFRREIYSLAATNGNAGACVFVTDDYSGVVEITLEDCPFNTYSIKGVIGGGESGTGFFTEQKGLPVKGNAVSLRVGKNEVYFITFYNK